MSAYDPLFDIEDLNEDRFYCRHGNFIGNPDGGDYLCGWCEDGISDEDFESYISLQENRQKRGDIRMRNRDNDALLHAVVDANALHGDHCNAWIYLWLSLVYQ